MRILLTQKKASILLSALDNYGGYPFNDVFDVVFPVYGTDEMDAARELSDKVALVIWGGADISPSIYGQVAGRWTSAGDKPSNRDSMEVKLAEHAMKLGIPIIGICRGAQLMCALSGGSLVQHVAGHGGGWHEITTNDGRTFNCPTLHHQMMYPWPRNGRDSLSEWESIAWMTQPKGKEYWMEPQEDGPDKAVVLTALPGPEPEIIYIPKTKALCIQSHPEFIHDDTHPFVVYSRELAQKYCL